jgi:hypothetical protein
MSDWRYLSGPWPVSIIQYWCPVHGVHLVDGCCPSCELLRKPVEKHRMSALSAELAERAEMWGMEP